MTTATARQEPAEPRQASAAIRTRDLRKTYSTNRGDVAAVRGVDLDIAPGEFFGLLGPDGAGKSTTIGMLTTLVQPTGGQAWVAGTEVTRDPVAVKRRIGVVGGQARRLRAVLTPSLGHMPLWAVLAALIGGTAIFGFLGTRTFRKRVVN